MLISYVGQLYLPINWESLKGISWNLILLNFNDISRHFPTPVKVGQNIRHVMNTYVRYGVQLQPNSHISEQKKNVSKKSCGEKGNTLFDPVEFYRMSYGFDRTKWQKQKLLRYAYFTYLADLTTFSVMSKKFSLKSYQDHYIFRVPLSNYEGHAVAQLVEALCYKSEGRGFDSRWCHWDFSLTYNPSGRTMALGLTQPLTEMSTRNISWGITTAGA
jgi:hypothetical protein